MIDIPKSALLAAAGAFLVIVPQEADTATAKRPKVTVLCLPPGGSAPVACNSARAGSVLELSMGDRSTAPGQYLLFREIDAVGPPKVVRVPLASAADTVRLAVPAQLCTYRSIPAWKVELGGGDRGTASVGVLRLRC